MSSMKFRIVMLNLFQHLFELKQIPKQVRNDNCVSIRLT